MTADGCHLLMMIGKGVPAPAPYELTSAVQSVEVTSSDAERSGFQIVFKAGRTGSGGARDYPALGKGLLEPWRRVILAVAFGLRPKVLIDGVITHLQHQPSNQLGGTIITATGEDLSALMDRKEETKERSFLDAQKIVEMVLIQYAHHGIIPEVKAPPFRDASARSGNVAVQTTSDLQYISDLAEKYGYVFYLKPGPMPGASRAYWGAQPHGSPQKALTMNMGTGTNLDSLDFSYDGTQASTVSGFIQDGRTNKLHKVAVTSGSQSALSRNPAIKNHPREEALRVSGPDGLQAKAIAQGAVDRSLKAVTGNGVLDGLKYRDVLQARELVDVRGVGQTFDGSYIVHSVSHTLSPGSFRTSFEIGRDGTGSLKQRVKT